mmetsp:Transcript_12061/g.51758  ORF Transcript_12061/g.51758 Transcript_12061/m.51758 type:complete len:380 (+) Transcript_12061:2220-3359(+)
MRASRRRRARPRGGHQRSLRRRAPRRVRQPRAVAAGPAFSPLRGGRPGQRGGARGGRERRALGRGRQRGGVRPVLPHRHRRRRQRTRPGVALRARGVPRFGGGGGERDHGVRRGAGVSGLGRAHGGGGGRDHHHGRAQGPIREPDGVRPGRARLGERRRGAGGGGDCFRGPRRSARRGDDARRFERRRVVPSVREGGRRAPRRVPAHSADRARRDGPSTVRVVRRGDAGRGLRPRVLDDDARRGPLRELARHRRRRRGPVHPRAGRAHGGGGVRDGPRGRHVRRHVQAGPRGRVGLAAHRERPRRAHGRERDQRALRAVQGAGLRVHRFRHGRPRGGHDALHVAHRHLARRLRVRGPAHVRQGVHRRARFDPQRGNQRG